MTDAEKLEWARIELERRAEEEAAVTSPEEMAEMKRLRAFRRRRAGLSRAETRDLLARVAMAWAA